MGFSEFVKDNRILIIIVVVIIIALFIYYFLFYKNQSTVIIRPRVTVARDNKFDSCMDPKLQEKIANRISEKINEMQGCDCDALDSEDPTDSVDNTSIDSTAQLRSNIREAFKKI